MATTATRAFTPTRYQSAEGQRRERVTPAAAPEFVQRIERAREFNIRCAQLRILDREFYREYRRFIRIPVNEIERARNERWATLRAALGGRQRFGSMVSLVKAVRESQGLPVPGARA